MNIYKPVYFFHVFQRFYRVLLVKDYLVQDHCLDNTETNIHAQCSIWLQEWLVISK